MSVPNSMNVYQIYSHKFAVFVAAASIDEVMTLQPYNSEMDTVTILNEGDFLLLHEHKKQMSVQEYLQKNIPPHVIGHCYTEGFEYAGGTVEVVLKHNVEQGINFFWVTIQSDE